MGFLIIPQTILSPTDPGTQLKTNPDEAWVTHLFCVIGFMLSSPPSTASSLNSVVSCYSLATTPNSLSRSSSVTLQGFAPSNTTCPPRSPGSSDYMASFENSPVASLPPYATDPMINIADDSPAGQAAAEVPYFPSISTRVLGLHPPVIFECAISFIVFLSEKNKRNQIMWVPLKPLSDLSVLFNT
ncbi:hypothetical protein PCANC_10689 [Puccinia coronata f. sp. avenae]|uniref:Uncharacterized protein n=1 Tax=Puccinia coronata f. sp. avenae TaxID=200324 RepID=A0A2N5SQ81_9BASI|nr:hypothetical protein PCASD_20313 [Puccinia coronata f. sp. avenae]PLW41291.1 hypothetical protein PCASD_10866 [Puccinia coronata f. sp. avenae]PLW48954.1 hypothetical protein PCANC_10689 [Puccinia coronata f. sp. avenae]